MPRLVFEFLARMSNLSRNSKRFVQAIIDYFAICFALWLAYSLRLSHIWPEQLSIAWWLFIILPLCGLLIFWQVGIYRIVLRGMGRQTYFTLAKAVVLLAIVLGIIAYMVPQITVPRSVPIIFAITLLGLLAALRAIEEWLLLSTGNTFERQEPVLIYGAGSAGRQLAAALEKGHQFTIAGFVDDDPTLRRHVVAGYGVLGPADLEQAIAARRVKRILIAIPGIAQDRRRDIIQSIAQFGLPIQTVPSVAEVVAGIASIDQLRPISADELLDRTVVSAQPELLDRAVRGQVVLVTGAGGSIGSELCRQILAAGPAEIILYDLSEFALYSIDEELRHLAASGGISVMIRSVLGSTCDSDRVDGVFRQCAITTVFHAAAYKHVPLVEQNAFEAIHNNVIGTDILVQMAIKHDVDRFVLVSTDKAVRPTSVMGATKRLAELVVHARDKAASPIFSVVRFGNVLASSGSVIPLFRKQIARGGPVTVTHREATRFFMTIPEAAQLVVQAAGLEYGGTFVLEMGAPVAIDGLARRMINLSGLRIRDATDPQGDIEIVYSGLRPGEKLHEEVSLSGSLAPTVHPKIMRVEGEDNGTHEIDGLIDELHRGLGEHNLHAVVATIERAVEGYSPGPYTGDLLAQSPARAELVAPS